MTGRDVIWVVIGAACFFMLLVITVPHAQVRPYSEIEYPPSKILVEKARAMVKAEK